MSSTSERKQAEHRMRMLQFAETLGNVSEACRKMGISREIVYSTFVKVFCQALGCNVESQAPS